jgi:lipopolysaccharide/colanic/teichoic acid biosynthesis glycosyltransferase
MRYSAPHRHSSANGVLGGRKRAAIGGRLKRGFDAVVATLVLVLLAPILVVTSVLIRLLLGRPILVTERSVGLGGQVFARLSFRTEPNSSTPASPWIEAIMTALRASGIDKLPHLYNVVRGDMSLVGPELIEAQHAQDYGMGGPELLLARPGMVSVRRHGLHILRSSTGQIGPERFYLQRWSLWLDLRILCGALARSHATDAHRPTK